MAAAAQAKQPGSTLFLAFWSKSMAGLGEATCAWRVVGGNWVPPGISGRSGVVQGDKGLRQAIWGTWRP